MKQTRSFLLITSLLLFGSLGCATPQTLLTQQDDALEHPLADYLYSFQYLSTSATGKCASTIAEKWYGTNIDYDIVAATYDTQLINDGWQRLYEVDNRVWKKITDKGEFVFAIDVFSRGDEIVTDRVEYTLPDSITAKAEIYTSMYVITLSFMTSASVRRCYQ